MDWNDIVPGCVTKEGTATFACFPAIFKNVTNAAFIFAGTAALFFILFSSVKFITSRGDPKKFENARETLTYAILGLIIILLSAFVVNVISYLTGVSCINLFGFTNCK